MCKLSSEEIGQYHCDRVSGRELLQNVLTEQANFVMIFVYKQWLQCFKCLYWFNTLGLETFGMLLDRYDNKLSSY